MDYMNAYYYADLTLRIIHSAWNFADRRGDEVLPRDLIRALNKHTEGEGLNKFGRDLTQEIRNDKQRTINKIIDPVVGRDDEIEQLIEILCCRRKNNPVLLGEAGVGKTAIVEGLHSESLIKRCHRTLQKRGSSPSICLMSSPEPNTAVNLKNGLKRF